MLEVKDLTVHYGMIQAVRDVSFTVNEGEIVTLIGANGAGKTTILRALSGLERTKSGEISYLGRSLDRLSPQQRVKDGISHVPEGRHVFKGLSVKENLELGAFLRKDREAVEEDLEQIYQRFPVLKERLKQDAATLSGGEQQRVAIARSLITRPAIILADEPTGNLDRKNSEEITGLFRLVNKRLNSTIMIITHDEKVANSCDKVYRMVDGRLNFLGDETYENY